MVRLKFRRSDACSIDVVPQVNFCSDFLKLCAKNRNEGAVQELKCHGKH